MAEAVLSGIKRASGWSIVLGILMIIAGIIAMLAPWESGLVITLVVGWSAIFNGVAQIIFGFRTHGGWHVLAGSRPWDHLHHRRNLSADASGRRLAGADFDAGIVPAGLRDFRAGAGISE